MENQLGKRIRRVEDTVPNFPKIEEKIIDFWNQNCIFQKSVEQRDINNKYTFVDGPPFVTGIPHYGSLLPSIAKDVIPRYWTMKGKRVRRVWGWDCHGLPIEEKVNKKFGILSSRQLEDEMGIDKYISECRNWVLSCSNEWRWYINRIGRWADMDNAYYTMSVNFMESVIWAFKQIYEKGYIYKGKRVSLFSTDTSTPVSNFEVEMDPDNYRETEDLSVFVKFKLKYDTLPEDIKQLVPNKELFLLAWTTTPWTLPSNFALAVNPQIDYCLVEFQNEFFILAKKRLEYTFSTDPENVGFDSNKLVKILSEFKGSRLSNVEYYPIYDFFVDKATQYDFRVILFEGVTEDDGTGVLHVAPAFGEEDFELGKKYNLSDYPDIDETGKLTVGDWKGIYIRNALELIAEDLAKKGLLFRSELYVHRLPYYRGPNPLIYMAQDSYFINIQKIKDRLIELSKDINWIPHHIKEGLWLNVIKNSPDWAISRNRYWATIMPIWKSADGDEIVIGSIEEMMQFTNQITKVIDESSKPKYFFEGKPMDLHRDIADKIVLEKDGKKYYRIPEVLDCWVDSACAPFAEYHYPFENKELFESSMPADYIIEYMPQVRAWFNVLHRLSTLIFDRRLFTNVICTGSLAGNDGRKMSKSFGNYTDPKDVLNNIGGEALRLYLMGSRLMIGEDASWSDEILNEQVKNVLLPLWNIYRYFTIYADLHKWIPNNANFIRGNILDEWIESYVKSSVLNFSASLESYNIPQAVKLIQPTIDAISTWWIRRSRERFVNGDPNALQNLYAALVLITKGFAPQLVFLTEEIYQNIIRNILPDTKESVHLEDYPIIDAEEINYDLIEEMNLVRKICNLVNSIRNQNFIKIKQPLKELVIVVEENEKSFKNLGNELIEIIKQEANVKEIYLKKEFSNSDNKYKYSTEENIHVYLDTTLYDDLVLEGLYAEVKRVIQSLRKSEGYNIGEKLNLQFFTNESLLKKVFLEFEKNLKNDCVLGSIFEVSNLDLSFKTFKIKEFNLSIRLSRTD